MLRLIPVLALPLLAACGSAADVPDSGPGPEAPDAVPASADADPIVSAIVSDPWIVPSQLRILDGLDDVVGRYADDVTGAVLEQVIPFARCLGNRTEVQLEWGVALGNDVSTDEAVTKRVLLRFVPHLPEVAVWSVSNTRVVLVVSDPVRFLRRFLGALKVIVQTTSWNGTVLFAHFVVGPAALRDLFVVAESCGWILDPAEAEAAQRRDADALFAIERQRVSTPTSVRRSVTTSARSASRRTARYTWTCRPPSRGAYLGFRRVGE